MNRALGLVMAGLVMAGLVMAGAALPIGSDQSLQVASGRAEFPVRVRNCTPAIVPRQLSRPQRATDPESCTGDSNQPLDAEPFSRRSSFPRLPVAANTPFAVASNRVASPSLACATSVVLPPAVLSV